MARVIKISGSSSAIKPSRSAFTLIEVSIVLVVIGLLTAGILLGRDLIRASEVRAQVSQIEQLNTAVNTFRLKYKCIPGDCVEAFDFGLTDASGNGDNGNGNDIVEVGINPWVNGIGLETRDFWFHLGKASLIAEYPYGTVPGINSPPLKMQGSGTTDNKSGGLWLVNEFRLLVFNGSSFVLGKSLAPAWLLTTSTRRSSGDLNDSTGVYDAIAALAIDSKIDDGYPLQGNMIITNGQFSLGYGNNHLAGLEGFSKSPAFPDACYDKTVTPAIYNTAQIDSLPLTNTRFCMPVIRAAF